MHKRTSKRKSYVRSCCFYIYMSTHISLFSTKADACTHSDCTCTSVSIWLFCFLVNVSSLSKLWLYFNSFYKWISLIYIKHNVTHYLSSFYLFYWKVMIIGMVMCILVKWHIEIHMIKLQITSVSNQQTTTNVFLLHKNLLVFAWYEKVG